MNRAEAKIQREIVLALGALPGVLVFENGTDRTEKVDRRTGKTWHEHNGLGPGTPDLVLSVFGRLVGLEVKAPDGAPEPSQLGEQKRWHRGGAFYAFVRSVDEARAALERATRGELA